MSTAQLAGVPGATPEEKRAHVVKFMTENYNQASNSFEGCFVESMWLDETKTLWVPAELDKDKIVSKGIRAYQKTSIQHGNPFDNV